MERLARMAVKWFRFYTEAAYHREIQELPPVLFKFWVNVLCLANSHEPRGTLPPVDDIGYALHMTAKQARAHLDNLTSAGLVDAETGAIHNWKKWQPDSDARATEGRREHDDSRRKVDGKWGDSAATSPPVRRNPAEADSDKTKTQNRSDLETEGEGEAERARPFVLFEKAFGKPVPNEIQAERLIALEEEHGAQCLEHSLVEAARAEADLRYAEKVMARHKREGCEDKPVANSAAPADLSFFEDRYRRVKEAT